MKPKEFVAALIDIEELEQGLEWDTEKLARDAGWDHSCGWPDCCWRWTKTFEGREIQASSAKRAVEIERSILVITNPEAWPQMEDGE